jgi:hypothetical protein
MLSPVLHQTASRRQRDGGTGRPFPAPRSRDYHPGRLGVQTKATDRPLRARSHSRHQRLPSGRKFVLKRSKG